MVDAVKGEMQSESIRMVGEVEIHMEKEAMQ